jgi:hypothetical protein
VVRDYKTGSAVTAEGNLKAECVQLQCYAMITEAISGAEVLLLWTMVTCTRCLSTPVRGSSSQFHRWCSRVHAATGSDVSAAELAKLALPARRVRIELCVQSIRCRHLNGGRITRLALNVFLRHLGHVLQITCGGAVSVTIEDACGRRVQVDRLDTRHGFSNVKR